ncbi:nickel pincer cofactor biosynthesis protein LarC [Clostridium fermenticellae]|uniref:Pyridinium-3,5-bisthiocarboxylic acid mononucleotide nickel insertion protein n=1 Tax=Clostridium fermenticellae TaxID=2068654 RepID=A0A386H3X7_9CLOT|nr:nickel pincer cofactor biosynthesis protein LarC [Clostridium fermenticellae]AYD40429.1 nickel pincer cofactor biosynthesis protein LarC [Clostridium fermenticellae]
MRILYYDCFCGISGDMNLAALVDLGVPKEYLICELLKLNIDFEYKIVINKVCKMGINGTRVDIKLNDSIEGNERNHTHIDHKNLKYIKHIINLSDLNDNVKHNSLKTFTKIAEAEARLHGKTMDEVYFHEVGEVNLILNIVGAAICIDYLKIDRIISSKVQVGGGFTKCADGVMPVPVPVTAEILKDVPIKIGIVQFETTTPIGAAILKANVDEFTEEIDFLIKNTGYGIGHNDLKIPNVLRLYLGEKDIQESIDEQYIIETNIDDMNPELYGYVEEKLFEVGALDVYKTSIFMKKGRPGIKLSVLTNDKSEKDILDIIFNNTTSIGVRRYKVRKIMLDRSFSKVKTEYGDITIKKSYYKGKLIKYKPEYEECKIISKEKDIPIDRIYKSIYKQNID